MQTRRAVVEFRQDAKLRFGQLSQQIFTRTARREQVVGAVKCLEMVPTWYATCSIALVCGTVPHASNTCAETELMKPNYYFCTNYFNKAIRLMPFFTFRTTALFSNGRIDDGCCTYVGYNIWRTWGQKRAVSLSIYTVPRFSCVANLGPPFRNTLLCPKGVCVGGFLAIHVDLTFKLLVCPTPFWPWDPPPLPPLETLYPCLLCPVNNCLFGHKKVSYICVKLMMVSISPNNGFHF